MINPSGRKVTTGWRKVTKEKIEKAVLSYVCTATLGRKSEKNLMWEGGMFGGDSADTWWAEQRVSHAHTHERGPHRYERKIKWFSDNLGGGVPSHSGKFH